MRITIKLMLILALVSTPAVAANLFVPTQFGTIQAAVDAASPGDRILVAAGMYDGALITKRVKIAGEGNQTVIINGPTGQSSPSFFQNGFELSSGADGTTISDLRIDLDPGSVDVLGGVVLVQVGIFGVGVDRVAVHDVELIGLNGGIDFRSSHKWRIIDNTIEGLNSVEFPGFVRRAIGIRVVESSGSLIAFNTITHDGSSDDNTNKRYRGIELIFRFPDRIPVVNNKLIQNEIAIVAPGASEVTDIRLIDVPAFFGGPVVEIFNNKLIQNEADPIVIQPELLIDHNVIQ